MRCLGKLLMVALIGAFLWWVAMIFFLKAAYQARSDAYMYSDQTTVAEYDAQAKILPATSVPLAGRLYGFMPDTPQVLTVHNEPFHLVLTIQDLETDTIIFTATAPLFDQKATMLGVLPLPHQVLLVYRNSKTNATEQVFIADLAQPGAPALELPVPALPDPISQVADRGDGATLLVQTEIITADLRFYSEYVWNLQTGATTLALPEHQQRLLLKDHEVLGFVDGALRRFDPVTTPVSAAALAQPADQVGNLKLFGAGDVVMETSRGWMVVDGTTLQPIVTIAQLNPWPINIRTVAFSRTNNRFVVGGSRSNYLELLGGPPVVIYSTESGQPMHSVNVEANKLRFSLDGRTLWINAPGGLVKVDL